VETEVFKNRVGTKREEGIGKKGKAVPLQAYAGP
jgi:hypothetical protein